MTEDIVPTEIEGILKLAEDEGYIEIVKEKDITEKELELDNSISKYVDHVYYEICKKEDKAIRQKITEYALNNYKEVKFLDEDAINEIISLGITEYLKRKAEGSNNE